MLFQRVLFQTADLSLGDADFPGNLHLGFSFVETHFDNVFFPVIQAFHGLLQGQILNPVFLSVLFITDLIHNIQGIPALCVYRFVEADRALDGIQGIDNVFFFNANLLGNLIDGRLFEIFLDVIFALA